MTPAEVKACSPWEFAAAVNGWAEANGSEDRGGLSAADQDDLWAGVQERMH